MGASVEVVVAKAELGVIKRLLKASNPAPKKVISFTINSSIKFAFIVAKVKVDCKQEHDII